MKDLDIKTLNGTLNVEYRTDGSIGIYYETTADPQNTLMLDKEQMIELAGWLITYIEQSK